MNSLFFSKNNSSNDMQNNRPSVTAISPVYTFRKWIIAHNQMLFDKKYDRFLISQTFIDKAYNEYRLNP
jgi:hypothetical protein